MLLPLSPCAFDERLQVSKDTLLDPLGRKAGVSPIGERLLAFGHAGKRLLEPVGDRAFTESIIERRGDVGRRIPVFDLGFLLVDAQTRYNVPMVFGVLTMYLIMCMVMVSASAAAEKRLSRWRD